MKIKRNIEKNSVSLSVYVSNLLNKYMNMRETINILKKLFDKLDKKLKKKSKKCCCCK